MKTLKERKEDYQKAKKLLECDRERRGNYSLCRVMASFSKKENINLKCYPEIMCQEPTEKVNYYGAEFWFDQYDIKPRLEVLDKAIEICDRFEKGEFKIEVTPEQGRIIKRVLFLFNPYKFNPYKKKYIDNKYLYVLNNKILLYDDWESTFKKRGLPQITFNEFNEKYTTMEIKLKKENILSAAEECPEAKKVLEKLCPEVFDDGRVDFGEKVIFTINALESKEHPGAYIGCGNAKKGDKEKVLISNDGYKWVLRDDYYDGNNAVELVKK